MFTAIQQRSLPATLMVRLIEANQKAGSNVNMVDNINECYPIQGGIRLEPNNKMHKMTIGDQRLYVSDVNTLVNQGQLSLKVTK